MLIHVWEFFHVGGGTHVCDSSLVDPWAGCFVSVIGGEVLGFGIGCGLVGYLGVVWCWE